MIQTAATNGADVIVLPEMWSNYYDSESVKQNAEPKIGTGDCKAASMLSTMAKKCAINLIGGTIPEQHEKGITNTCYCFNREGELVATH